MSTARPTPVAPAFGTPPVSAPSAAAAGGLDVRHEVLVRLHGDDAAFLRPDLLEGNGQQRASLGLLGLDLGEAWKLDAQRLVSIRRLAGLWFEEAAGFQFLDPGDSFRVWRR